jgi:hypothetical protein
MEKDVIINILKDNNGKLGITNLIKEIKKSTEFKSAICRDLIITAGAKGIVVISKNPPNQLIVELPT